MSRGFFLHRSVRAGLAALLLGLSGCSSGGSGTAFVGTPGEEQAKPEGGSFFLDAHRGGRASRLHLVECLWGRLVDVHGLLENGAVDPLPAFRDLLIRESLQSDGLDYRLETSAITQRTRLVVLRRRGAADAGLGTFEELLARARSNLPPVLVRDDDGSSPPPFSLVPRNACLSLRFDDLLADDEAAQRELARFVAVRTGYPAELPFEGRVLFDPNHGGLSGSAFHSTRVLVDSTVSEEEASQGTMALAVNSTGFPASVLGDARPNLSVRLPTRTDPGAGLFRVLTNLQGSALDPGENGPIDEDTRSLEVVRAMRAGRSDDANAGFLLDLNRPSLLGRWPAIVTEASFEAGGEPGIDLLLDLDFEGRCLRSPVAGDIVQRGDLFLEVRANASAPDSDGEVHGVRVRSLAVEPLAIPELAEGLAEYLTTFAFGLFTPSACWSSVNPVPGDAPDGELLSSSQFVLRFSEPMDPARIDPFESVRLVRGNPSQPLTATTVVVAEVRPSPDLRTFTLRPLLPLSFGLGGEYFVAIDGSASGPTDLAGNLLAGAPPNMQYSMADDQGQLENGGIVLRFAAQDELEPLGAPDLRGQLFYDFERGRIRGRLPVAESFAADSSQPVPSIMIPFGPGVQTPLSSFGSKLQTVWRYCDLGWTADDESKHNLDVVGLSWTPVGGIVIGDFFPRFEMRLAHSRRLPDEHRTFTGTTWSCSGLGAGDRTCPPCQVNVPFEDNILRDPRSPQRTVHDRSLGYRVQQRDVYRGVSGRAVLPYPLNRGSGPEESFTWRDTAVQAKDGTDSGGIPLEIEVSPPLGLVPGPAGRLAPGGSVPAWGLPLLIEIRCFPSEAALGFNPLEIYLAQNAQQLPNFRAYSTGGVNSLGVSVRVDPDLSTIPEGGFNPRSRPPGQGTAFQADNSFYTGELATVVRLSRAHSIWIRADIDEPRYFPPVTVPRPDDQPGRARLELEFRGASSFSASGLVDGFDSRALDPLGDIGFGDVQFFRGDPTWHADLTELDGAQYFQVRFTFVNDLGAGVTAELSALGIAWEGR
jgi:hypothetical protein